MTDPNSDLVYLSVGPYFQGDAEYYERELRPRTEVPDHAVRGAGTLQSDGTDGGAAGQWYEEWVIEAA